MMSENFVRRVAGEQHLIAAATATPISATPATRSGVVFFAVRAGSVSALRHRRDGRTCHVFRLGYG
jgi:hypothetical protein